MRATKLALAIISIIIAIHTKAQNQKPNIILILADDVGFKIPNINGGKSYSTPNIDALAKTGMNFTQCHASPICCPSRFLLLTGKYNFRNYTKWGNMPKSEKTIGNLFKDAGYKTACFGKWQLNGGDGSIHVLGFENYCVWGPNSPDVKGSRYKSPLVYADGKYIADSLTNGKYGEDIFCDSVMKFMEKNKTAPFFIYYPMVSAHSPFQPTPDDTDFDSWNSVKKSDTAYFPSMIKYMDKKIGRIINKVKNLGIENNTIIMYVGDNGTCRQISEYVDDDSLIEGGKGLTIEDGIRVPLIVSCPGLIKAGSINNNLVEFTDFLVTLADIANVPVPTTYNPQDGISFAPMLAGEKGTPRDWLFDHYDRQPEQHLKNSKLKRWAQTITYKLYDTCASSKTRLFYNIISDPKEESPIPDDLLTAEETIIKQKLLKVINNYIAQGTALFADPAVSDITDSSALITNTILINGGSTVTSSGVVWSKNPNPTISSSHTNDNICIGSFSTAIKGLIENTTYYIKTYATNFAGTAYSNQISFKTSLKVPVATKATAADTNKFTANWKAYTGATNYRLDVSTSPTFSKLISSTLNEGFDNGIILPAGWAISNTIVADTFSFGNAAPSLLFTKSKAELITNQLIGSATQLKFWIKGLNMDDTSSLLIEGFDGNTWVTIATLTKLPNIGTTKAYNANSNPPLKLGFIQFRFIYTKKIGKLLFDDVSIDCEKSLPFFVSGYSNLFVNTNSKVISGLNPATNYYYRVRAKTEDGSTGNSNVITVTTKKIDSVNDIANYQTGTHMESGAASIAKKEMLVSRYFQIPHPVNLSSHFKTAKMKNLK